MMNGVLRSSSFDRSRSLNRFIVLNRTRAAQRQGLLVQHGLHGEPRGRRIEAMLCGEISAVSDNRVYVLHDLEALERILLMEANRLPNEFQYIDDPKRPVTLVRTEFAVIGVVNHDQGVHACVAGG